MMRRIALLCIMAGAILALNSAHAAAPSWRGMENPTHQMWTFDGGDMNPAMPDVSINPGMPELTIQGGFPFTAWLPEDNGHIGVWKFEDWVEVVIPNYDIPNPVKEVWIQLTYSGDNIGQGLPATIQSVPTATGVVAELIDQDQIDDFYWTETYQLIIEPNPDSETIFIQPRNCTMFLDSIEIDTICRTPEPMTIGLLGLGSLALLRRRRAS